MESQAPLDLSELRRKLQDYDESVERCDEKLKRVRNWAPDNIRSDDPEYHDYDMVEWVNCRRAKGHSGGCQNSRAILGWPGFKTLKAMISELEILRARVEASEKG